MSNPETVADRGEVSLIEAITKRLPQGKQVLVPPGDDAAVVQIGTTPTVVTTDVLVSGVHFRTDWADANDIGRRAAAATLADIVAMGGDPVAVVVALVAPAATESAWALRLADGLRDECALVGASVVGGDVSSGDQLTITVSGVGDLKRRSPVLRSGAATGDQVAVAGRLGWAAAGLAVLSRGFGTPRALVQAYRRPEVDYSAGLKAAASATAMCDVSDGLLADAARIARASEKVIDIETESLDVAEPIAAVASAYGIDPLRWILSGGEDHAFVATFPAKRRLPRGFVRVGRVREPVDGNGDGDSVTVDGAQWPDETGYAHFSGAPN